MYRSWKSQVVISRLITVMTGFTPREIMSDLRVTNSAGPGYSFLRIFPFHVIHVHSAAFKNYCHKMAEDNTKISF
jgi:hypothetical protein